MLPVIALVGRPNVGKSTLFNRLTKTRDALVAEIAGLTRDRKYGDGKVGELPYILIDTGGISGEEEGIDEAMAAQSLQAISEADAVFFMLDVSDGLMPADEKIAQHLRVNQKQVYLIANKIDGKNPDIALADFYALGMGEPLAIAAAHNRGVSSLMDYCLPEIYAKLPESNLTEELVLENTEPEQTVAVSEAENSAKQSVKIAIVGRPNVGKSTLINRILGEQRVVVFDKAGTTRDNIYIPFEREDKSYTLIDTAGIRRRKNITEAAEKFSIIKTLQAIQDAHVCVLMLDAHQGIVEQDLHMLSFIMNSGRALIVCINKWDGMSEDKKQQVKESLERRFEFLTFAQFHFISALHGTGVGHLYKDIDQAYRSAMSKFPTNQLTRVLEDAVASHAPPMVRGRRPKLRYAHQGGSNPPLIIVHGNLSKELPDGYKRYLANTFRRVLNIQGTPIRFEFKQGDNPFAEKKTEVRHRSKRRAQAVEKTANIRRAKISKQKHK